MQESGDQTLLQCQTLSQCEGLCVCVCARAPGSVSVTPRHTSAPAAADLWPFHKWGRDKSFKAMRGVIDSAVALTWKKSGQIMER